MRLEERVYEFIGIRILKLSVNEDVEGRLGESFVDKVGGNDRVLPARERNHGHFPSVLTTNGSDERKSFVLECHEGAPVGR